MLLSTIVHLPVLHATASSEDRDLPEPVVIPGCIPLRSADLADVMKDRNNEAYRWGLEIANLTKKTDGILVDCFVILSRTRTRLSRKQN